MANLEKVVKLTQEQYNILAAGGTVGSYTGLDPTYLYMVEDMGGIIVVTNGIDSAIKEFVIANPATLLKYQEYIYVPQYFESGDSAPTYYNCFEGDAGIFRYLTVDWDLLTVTSHQVDYNDLPNLTSVTYSELATKILRGQLIPGRFYRITDFVTTTAQARTRSVGHQFDLIVQAISANELSEDASACLHSGDTYFANSNLKAWVIKYSFANNADKYAWADTTNGKGVIYYMKDEFFNECGYDFKNIQFARYKVTACADAPTLVGKYIGIVGIGNSAVLTNRMTIDTTDYKWCFTFDMCQTDYSMNAIGTTVVTPTGNVTLNQIQCTKCFIAPHENDSTKFYLNNVTVLVESNRDCMLIIKGFPMDASLLGGASAFEALTIQSSVIGGGKVALDGYIGQASSVVNITNSLLYSENSGRAVIASKVGYITNSCLVTTGTYVIFGSTVGYVSNTVIKSGSYSITQSQVDYMANNTITCSAYGVYRSNISVILSCVGSGVTSYFVGCTGGQVYGVNTGETALNDAFMSKVTFGVISTITATCIYNCNIPSLSYCTFKKVTGCSFINSTYITCSQDLNGCNFGNNVSYLNISSTTTSQTITNTNFHDITGTDASNLKNVVIPEDYTDTHTVEIYSANQYRIYEIS